MHIRHLYLTNFRRFATLELDFERDVTVLIAPNGLGKTAVLDAIAVGFGTFVGAFDDAKGRNFCQDDVRRIKIRKTKLPEMEAQYPVRLMMLGGIKSSHDLGVVRELRSPKSHTTYKDTIQLIHAAKNLQHDVRNPARSVETVLPLLAYYGTGRLWDEMRLKQVGSESMRSRLSGYKDCLVPSSSFKYFVEWFSHQVKADLEERMVNFEAGAEPQPSEFAPAIAAVQKAVNTCLEITGWGHLTYRNAVKEVVAVHSIHGELPVSQLSDGIRTMIGLVADIAYRALKLNPQLGDQATQQTKGIVLIDEIEMHLHPEWQQTVVPSLHKAFPGLQFIITTHSPQILTTVEARCIRRLVEDGADIRVEIPDFSLGAESGQLLEDLQGVSQRPPAAADGESPAGKAGEIVTKLNRYREYVSKDEWDSAAALALRQELDAWGREHEPELARLDVEIRMRKLRRQPR